MLDDDKILWIVLNCFLIIYTFFLFIYGSFYMKKESLSFKNIIDDNKGLFRYDSKTNIPNNILSVDDKNESLI